MLAIIWIRWFLAIRQLTNYLRPRDVFPLTQIVPHLRQCWILAPELYAPEQISAGDTEVFSYPLDNLLTVIRPFKMEFVLKNSVAKFPLHFQYLLPSVPYPLNKNGTAVGDEVAVPVGSCEFG